MSGELLSPITDALKPAGKKRGRKPGGGKVPGSGRKAGGANKVPKSLKDIILTRGRPIELLCDISRGVKIRVGPQAGPGEATYAYPTLQERAAAAKILIDKLVSPAPATPDAGTPSTAAPAPSDKDTVKRLLYMFAKADRDGRDESGMAELLSRHYPNAAKVLPAPRTIKVDRPHEPEAARRVIILDATGQVVTPPDEEQPPVAPPISTPPDARWAAHIEAQEELRRPEQRESRGYMTRPTVITQRPKEYNR